MKNSKEEMLKFISEFTEKLKYERLYHKNDKYTKMEIKLRDNLSSETEIRARMRTLLGYDIYDKKKKK